MTKIMSIPKVIQPNKGFVNNKMSRHKSNKIVAIDEKEHADRIAAAEAMSALSSMVIFSSECGNSRLVTRGTSPINIPSSVVTSFEATWSSNIGIPTTTCSRGISETTLVLQREIQMRTSGRISPCRANDSSVDAHEQNSSSNIKPLTFDILLIPTHLKSERITSGHEKTLPLKKRTLAREEIKMSGDGEDDQKNERTDAPIDGHLPSGTEMVSGCSQSISQDLVSHQQIPVDPSLSLSALTELAFIWKADEDGDLPLHIAVVHENINLVERFVHIMVTVAGRSVDKFNKAQQTPLHLAVELNLKDAVRCLLHAGSNPNLVDKCGHSAQHLAVKNQFSECLAILLSETKCKLELNSRNFEGFAPVHTSVFNNNISILKQLLDMEADIETVDGKSGRSALFHAVENNQMDIVEELQNRGANCDLPNYAGVTPLMAAQARNYHAVESVMMKNPNTRLSGDMVGNTSQNSSPPPSKIQINVGKHSQRLLRTTSMPYTSRPTVSQAEHVIDLTGPISMTTCEVPCKDFQSDPSMIPSVVISEQPQELQIDNNEKTENAPPSVMHVKSLLARQLKKQFNKRQCISEMPIIAPQSVYLKQLMQTSMQRVPREKHSISNPENRDTSDSNKDEKHFSGQMANRVDSDLANDQSQEKIVNRLPEVSNVNSSAMSRSLLLIRELKHEKFGSVESLD